MPAVDSPVFFSGSLLAAVETDRHEARLALGPIAIFDSLERVRQVPGDAADEEEMVMEGKGEPPRGKGPGRGSPKLPKNCL